MLILIMFKLAPFGGGKKKKKNSRLIILCMQKSKVEIIRYRFNFSMKIDLRNFLMRKFKLKLDHPKVV